MKRLAAGVDDAGRGSLLGPLVVAGVLYPEERMEELRLLGARDSKKLTPASRMRIAERIMEEALAHHVVEVPPEEVDRAVACGRKLQCLNFLEAKTVAQVIVKLKPQVAYVDSCDVDAGRFARQVAEHVPFKVEIVSEHHADEKYPIVGAASILAKVRRDAAIAKLREKYGDFGSGYPTDPRTVRFVEEWLRTRGEPPPFARKTWKTLRRMLPRGQLRLDF